MECSNSIERRYPSREETGRTVSSLERLPQIDLEPICGSRKTHGPTKTKRIGSQPEISPTRGGISHQVVLMKAVWLRFWESVCRTLKNGWMKLPIVGGLCNAPYRAFREAVKELLFVWSLSLLPLLLSILI